MADAIEMISQSQNRITIRGVKEGMATVKVTMTYNGQAQTFEKSVQVGKGGEKPNPNPNPAESAMVITRLIP